MTKQEALTIISTLGLHAETSVTESVFNAHINRIKPRASLSFDTTRARLQAYINKGLQAQSAINKLLRPQGLVCRIDYKNKRVYTTSIDQSEAMCARYHNTAARATANLSTLSTGIARRQASFVFTGVQD